MLVSSFGLIWVRIGCTRREHSASAWSNPLELRVAPGTFAPLSGQWLVFVYVEAAEPAFGSLTVTEAELRTHDRSVACGFQGMSMSANPAFLAGGIADDQAVVGHVFGDNGARAD